MEERCVLVDSHALSYDGWAPSFPEWWYCIVTPIPFDPST